MITGKLEYYGVVFPDAVGVCTEVQSMAQNGAATEWQANIEIFANGDALGIGRPLLSYPLLGWVDNDKSPIKELEALAIDLFFPGWKFANTPLTTPGNPADDHQALDVGTRE
ncbi:hypothetical protein FS595_19705 [Serratia rubidaea]|uniref:hypothetical protein n=1 Tax=Serratia rubidaea TaxID=61652 RepID=UPI001F46A90E|nr:hypothetical protein [Serratia rubidaea]UJD81809.1 hypothetical protein FS596_19700 [Serratia rubidaea]UJD86372.1 hypothetical protein FS595_19705 [Serratia rubidaea]